MNISGLNQSYRDAMAPQLEINWGDLPGDICEGFEQFHSDNPQVFSALVSMTRTLLGRGHRRIGMGMLFEVLRWEHYMKTNGEPFKLNNNYRAFYSRLIENHHPEWEGIYTKRTSLADERGLR